MTVAGRRRGRAGRWAVGVTLVALTVAGRPAAASRDPATFESAVESLADASVAPSAPVGDDTWVWSVGPTDASQRGFTIVAAPGTVTRGSLRITNLSADPITLDVYPADLATGPDGAIDLLPRAHVSVGVGAWTLVDRGTVTIAAGDHVDVAFSVVAPVGTPAGDYAGGIATALRTPGIDASGAAIIVERRLATRLDVRVTGAAADSVTVAAEVRDVEIDFEPGANPFAPGDLRVRYTVVNTGTGVLAADQRIDVPTRLGFAGRRAVLTAIDGLVPGASRDVDVTVPGVWPTLRTRADIRVAPDDGDTIVATATTWSVSTTAVLLVMVLAAAGAGAAWFAIAPERRRRQEAADAARTTALIDAAVVAALDRRPGLGSSSAPRPSSDVYDTLS